MGQTTSAQLVGANGQPYACVCLPPPASAAKVVPGSSATAATYGYKAVSAPALASGGGSSSSMPSYLQVINKLPVPVVIRVGTTTVSVKPQHSSGILGAGSENAMYLTISSVPGTYSYDLGFSTAQTIAVPSGTVVISSDLNHLPLETVTLSWQH